MLNSSDILRGYTDTIILAQLYRGDSYGYVISRNVQEISRGELQLKEATLYTTFRRLEAAGVIESYWGNENAGARSCMKKTGRTGASTARSSPN